MAQTMPLPFPVTLTAARSESIPWYVWSYLISVVSAVIGATWDISWHMSIGRDTFFSPPHLLIYNSGILGGITAAWLILRTTFSADSPMRAASIRMWGFRGPLGAFLAAWGAVAMITSGPYDDWWHNAYGLDTKILSPPHIILAFGLLGIRFGAMLVTLGEMNRAAGELKKRLRIVFLLIGAMVVGISIGTFLELTTRNLMHSARFYAVLGCSVPVVLVAVREASGHRWAATIAAGIVCFFQAGLLWVLPLFPAEPKLGPVFQNVTHFIPSQFPILVVAPALLLDLLRQRRDPVNRWAYAAMAGPLFVAGLLAVQWPFADFLNSPLARNWFFGAQYFPYFLPPSSDLVRNVYTPVETSQAQFMGRLAFAFLGATVSARAGLAWGQWMQRLQR